MNDIKRILDKESKRHYIGTIVYVIVGTDYNVRERAVVDGQQRLITMFLIAHALKEIAKEHGETDISNILTTSYLENRQTMSINTDRKQNTRNCCHHRNRNKHY